MTQIRQKIENVLATKLHDDGAIDPRRELLEVLTDA